MRTIIVTLAAAAAVALTGCSSEAEPETAPAAAVESATDRSASRDELAAAAKGLDMFVASGDAESAWAFYSQRCKDKIGTLEEYGRMLDLQYADRAPQPIDWTVHVNGSSGRVVTVDADASASADSWTPRTWTFADGSWQFDNC